MCVVYFAKGHDAIQALSFQEAMSKIKESGTKLHNRTPKYSERMRTYCLNFQGRVTIPSVKNFQITTEEGENVLQFGRVGRDLFHMDLEQILPTFLALGVCLSTFDAVERV